MQYLLNDLVDKDCTNYQLLCYWRDYRTHLKKTTNNQQQKNPNVLNELQFLYRNVYEISLKTQKCDL